MKHPAAANAVRFSPDGQRILTACDDGLTRLWSASNGQLLAQTGRGRRPIIDVSFNRNGRLMLSVAESAPVEVYAAIGGATAAPMYSDAASLAAVARPASAPSAEEMKGLAEGHSDEVTFADMSPSGSLIATASADRTVRIWHRASHEPVYDPLVHDALVNCARFSRDGRLLVTSTASGKVRVWDTAEGQPITDWLRSREPVAQVWLSPDAAFVVTDQRQAWPIYTARDPAPPWLPELAEAVAGVRLNERRVMEPVRRDRLATLRARLAESGPPTTGLIAWANQLLEELTAHVP
jgi:WD40 repeat protein